jgi:hypothetical protein
VSLGTAPAGNEDETRRAGVSAMEGDACGSGPCPVACMWSCVFVVVCVFATLPRFHVRALCDALLPCACEVVRFHGTMYSVAGTDGV